MVLMLLWVFAVENDDGNTEPGVMSETGSNGVFKMMDPPMELIKRKKI